MKRPDLDIIRKRLGMGSKDRDADQLLKYIKYKENQTYDFDPHKVNSLDEILENLNIGKTVKCNHCHKEHDSNSEDFFTFYGNVCIGLKGGMIGNHIMDMTVKRVTILCRTKKCMEYLTKYIKE